MAPCVVQKAAELRDGVRGGPLHLPHTQEGAFARHDPVVDQQRVLDEKGRHAEARGIADAERPRKILREFRRLVS